MVMLQGGLFQLLMHSSKVKYGATERDIVDPGRDLHGGVMEYIKDVIYLTATVQVACLFTDYAYLLLLVVQSNQLERTFERTLLHVDTCLSACQDLVLYHQALLISRISSKWCECRRRW